MTGRQRQRNHRRRQILVGLEQQGLKIYYPFPRQLTTIGNRSQDVVMGQ